MTVGDLKRLFEGTDENKIEERRYKRMTVKLSNANPICCR